ncbi:MAG TPA: amidohydrolase [Candidatus Limnocylindria bacterium]
MDPADPEARAVATRGDRIVAVGSERDMNALIGPSTRVIEIGDRLVLPGFIDAHTHFGNAAAWSFKIGLYDARDKDAVLAKVREAAGRVPDGLWITGGDVGAAAAWDADARGEPRPAQPPLDRHDLDAATPLHPVLVRRIDGGYVASSLALARARFDRHTPDPRGGRIERDEAGEPTGVLHGRAGERMSELMPPANMATLKIGAKAALEDLRKVGITSIHDVCRIDALSQHALFHTDVERSATPLEVFQELQRDGDLTVRVYAMLSLPLWREAVEHGICPRTDDGLIRFGAMKAFIDGWLMEEPYVGSSYRGDFTFRFTDEKTMAEDIRAADEAGFDPVVHCVGDKAHRLLLDWYEAAIAANPPRDRRFRVIHAWYPGDRGIERIGRMGLSCDVTPQHLVNDAPSLERKLGPERAKYAHPWRSLIDAGARLDLVSDWPGSYNEQRATPLSPLENIALAVNRSCRPEQALTVEEAVRAYTIAPAYASYEEDRKGSIAEGMVADLVLLSADVLSAGRDRIAAIGVDTTILGGSVLA